MGLFGKRWFESKLECESCDYRYGKDDLKTIIHKLTHRLDKLDGEDKHAQATKKCVDDLLGIWGMKRDK